MTLQQAQLDQLRVWLTNTEDRISRMGSIGPDFSNVKKQMELHKVRKCCIG